MVGVEPVVSILEEFSLAVSKAVVPPSHENVLWPTKGVCPWHFCFVNDILSFDKKFFASPNLVCYQEVLLLLEVQDGYGTW